MKLLFVALAFLGCSSSSLAQADKCDFLAAPDTVPEGIFSSFPDAEVSECRELTGKTRNGGKPLTLMQLEELRRKNSRADTVDAALQATTMGKKIDCMIASGDIKTCTCLVDALPVFVSYLTYVHIVTNPETYQIPLDQLLPSKKVPDGIMSTRKYKQIVSSIHEIGLIEPLAVIQPDASKSEYLLLDGHLRVLAFKELGLNEVACLFAKDDETYSYNHRVNRLSTIQEHYMIRRAIDRGVSKERLARAFNVNLSSINRRINLLSGICPEAIALLQDHQFTPDVTRILRNMKAARQVEAVELMVASNTITVAHVEALLKATPPEQRADVPPPERDNKTAPMEQLVKLEKEMSQVEATYKEAENHYGSDLLNLVVAKGYLTKLLANAAVKSYIERKEPEILSHLELVANTISMEEAVQQQQGGAVLSAAE